MGQRPISSHFFPLTATIGRALVESNAREEKNSTETGTYVDSGKSLDVYFMVEKSWTYTFLLKPRSALGGGHRKSGAQWEIKEGAGL